MLGKSPWSSFFRGGVIPFVTNAVPVHWAESTWSVWSSWLTSTLWFSKSTCSGVALTSCTTLAGLAGISSDLGLCRYAVIVFLNPGRDFSFALSCAAIATYCVITHATEKLPTEPHYKNRQTQKIDKNKHNTLMTYFDEDNSQDSRYLDEFPKKNNPDEERFVSPNYRRGISGACNFIPITRELDTCQFASENMSYWQENLTTLAQTTQKAGWWCKSHLHRLKLLPISSTDRAVKSVCQKVPNKALFGCEEVEKGHPGQQMAWFFCLCTAQRLSEFRKRCMNDTELKLKSITSIRRWEHEIIPFAGVSPSFLWWYRWVPPNPNKQNRVKILQIKKAD